MIRAAHGDAAGRPARAGSWVAAVLAICAVPPGPAGAQVAPIRLSLAEAVTMGIEASHRLGEVAARRDASEAAVQVARAGGIPQVSVRGGYMRTSHVEEFGFPDPVAGYRVLYPDVPDNWWSRLDLQWSLYSGGRVESVTRAAKAEADASGKDVDTVRMDLRLEIARAYWALVTYRDAVRVVEEALRRVEAYLADAKARFDAGFVPPNDVLSAEAQRSLQQSLLIEARNNVEIATLVLGRLLGVAAGTPIEPVEPLEQVGSAIPDATALVAEARQLRADRQAIEARIAAAVARRAVADAGRKPGLVVAGGVDYARPNPRIFPRADEWNDFWDVSLNATWLLFDGGRVKAEVAGADATERALRKRLDEFDSLLEVEVRQRRLEVGSSLARATAAAAAVRSAAEARRVLQDRYAAGVATSTEVLDAQVVLLEAELGRTRALAGVRLALAGLDRAVGRP